MKNNINLNIDLTIKQTIAWDYITDDVTTELGYGGGARGGKSWLGAEFINFMCLVYPRTRWLIGRKQLKNLKRTTLVTLFKVYRHHNIIEGEHYKYNDQMSIITYANGSEILLYDLASQPSDPLFTNLGGLEITGAWIDESNEVSYEAIDIINSRCGNWNNDLYSIKPLMIETFNPSKNHIYRRYYKPYKEGKLPAYRKFVPALVTDNPHVPQSYIEKLKQGSKITRERLLYGNFEYDDDPQKIFSYDAILNTFSNTFIKPNGTRYITGDVGGKGKDKTVLYVWDGWRIIHIFYESITDQADLYNRVEALRKEYNVPLSHVLLDYNGIGTGVVDMLGCVPFNAGMSPIDSTNSWQVKEAAKKPMFKNLRSQLWIYTAEEIINKNQMYISLDSIEFKGDPVNIREYITEELDAIKEIVEGGETKRTIISKGSSGEKSNKETIRQVLGRSPDFGDAIMMRAYYEFKPKAKISFG